VAANSNDHRFEPEIPCDHQKIFFFAVHQFGEFGTGRPKALKQRGSWFWRLLLVRQRQMLYNEM
jgi:hypothetical protein